MDIQKADSHRKAIIGLLSTQKLPVDDLPFTLDNFRVVLHDDEVIAVAGFEVYDSYALLRSVAVHNEFRNLGIADKLVRQVEALAGVNKLQAMYLLTETAANYFTRKGYETITRADVPEAVQQSTEFSHVCPQSAIVMKKSLNNYEKYISTVHR